MAGSSLKSSLCENLYCTMDQDHKVRGHVLNGDISCVQWGFSVFVFNPRVFISRVLKSPRFTALRFIALHRWVFFTNWRQNPSPAKILWLTLLRCWLYDGGLKPKPQYLWGVCLYNTSSVCVHWLFYLSSHACQVEIHGLISPFFFFKESSESQRNVFNVIRL